MAVKSPFATKKTQSYKYPEPFNFTEIEGETVREAVLEARKSLIDPEVEEAVQQGEQVWVSFRIPRSKADLDAISDLTQGLTLIDADGAHIEQRITKGNQGVFELLCEGWSFDREPNAVAYSELDTWAGDWVTHAMNDAMRQGTQRDYAKKIKNSSSAPDSSAPSTHVLPEQAPESE